MPKLGGWMWVGVFQCALRAQGWGIYVSWKYRLVLDILCQHLGAECKLEVSVRPSDAGWGNVHFWIYMLVLNISCQKLGDKCKLENIYFDRTSARGTSARLHNYLFWWPDKCQEDKCQSKQVPDRQVPEQTSARQTSAMHWHLSYWHLSRGKLVC